MSNKPLSSLPNHSPLARQATGDRFGETQNPAGGVEHGRAPPHPGPDAGAGPSRRTMFVSNAPPNGGGFVRGTGAPARRDDVTYSPNCTTAKRGSFSPDHCLTIHVGSSTPNKCNLDNRNTTTSTTTTTTTTTAASDDNCIEMPVPPRPQAVPPEPVDDGRNVKRFRDPNDVVNELIKALSNPLLDVDISVWPAQDREPTYSVRFFSVVSAQQ